MQVYDTAECWLEDSTGCRILWMYAIDSIAIHSVDDCIDDTEPKVGDGIRSSARPTWYKLCVTMKPQFQPDIQSLASSALLLPTPSVACRTANL
jgi:hypothetical protein